MQHWPQAGQLYDGRSLQSIGGGRWCCRCRWCCARRWGLLLAPSAMPGCSLAVKFGASTPAPLLLAVSGLPKPAAAAVAVATACCRHEAPPPPAPLAAAADCKRRQHRCCRDCMPTTEARCASSTAAPLRLPSVRLSRRRMGSMRQWPALPGGCNPTLCRAKDECEHRNGTMQPAFRDNSSKESCTSF